MFLFISLSAKQKDVTKYEWYRFQGQRQARFYNHHRTYDLDLEKGEVFGVRAARGFIGLVPQDALDVEFKLSFEEFEKLVKRCKGFAGKVDGKKVQKGLRGKDGRTPNKTASASPAPPTSSSPKPSATEDPQLTKFIQSLPWRGAKTAMHVHAEEVFGREIYHFYDVSTMLNSYRRKHSLTKPEMGSFAIELERLVEKAAQGDIDAEVGMTKYQGKMIPVLSCMIIKD